MTNQNSKFPNKKIDEKLKNIKLLILDVDGVLTDGRIVYGDYGDELKFFNVKDGVGVYLLKCAGIRSIIITAKSSRIIKRRAMDMGVIRVYQGATSKLKIYERLKKKFRLQDDEICFIGDDLIDLGVLNRVGFSVSVPEAPAEVKECCDYITENPGGKGAVRELAELILKTQGIWSKITTGYFK